MEFITFLIFSSNIEYIWQSVLYLYFLFFSKNVISLNNIKISFIWIFKPKWILYEYLMSYLWDVFNEVKWIWPFRLNFIELDRLLSCRLSLNGIFFHQMFLLTLYPRFSSRQHLYHVMSNLFRSLLFPII